MSAVRANAPLDTRCVVASLQCNALQCSLSWMCETMQRAMCARTRPSTRQHWLATARDAEGNLLVSVAFRLRHTTETAPNVPRPNRPIGLPRLGQLEHRVLLREFRQAVVLLQSAAQA